MFRLVLPALMLVGLASSLNAQYYPNLEENIPMENAYKGQYEVSELENAFNKARDKEEEQLDSQLPDIDFPDSAEWEAKSRPEKVLWIINEERVARGLMAFNGLDNRVSTIARDYVDYLARNDTFDHHADGRSPTERLEAQEDINNCMDYHWENLFFTGAHGSSVFRNFTGFALYNFIYNNAQSNWSHRKELLRKDYQDNNGDSGEEGLLGVGIKEASDYTYNGRTYGKAALLVLNGIDPCASFPEEDGTSLPAKDDQTKLTLYPNPAQTKVYFSEPSQVKAIKIYNAKGQKMPTSTSSNPSIDISGWAQGLYSIQIRTQNGTLVNRNLVVR